jgi:hypothetical protein
MSGYDQDYSDPASSSSAREGRRVVCRACGASLEVVVNFAGKIVWSVNPENPDFGAEQPSLRGESKNICVLCSADMMHACGYKCVNGVLVEI